jgi:hypothetical protein
VIGRDVNLNQCRRCWDKAQMGLEAKLSVFEQRPALIADTHVTNAVPGFWRLFHDRTRCRRQCTTNPYKHRRRLDSAGCHCTGFGQPDPDPRFQFKGATRVQTGGNPCPPTNLQLIQGDILPGKAAVIPSPTEPIVRAELSRATISASIQAPRKNSPPKASSPR